MLCGAGIPGSRTAGGLECGVGRKISGDFDSPRSDLAHGSSAVVWTSEDRLFAIAGAGSITSLLSLKAEYATVNILVALWLSMSLVCPVILCSGSPVLSSGCSGRPLDDPDDPDWAGYWNRLPGPGRGITDFARTALRHSPER